MTPPIKPDPPSFYAMLVDALKRHAASTAPPRRPALPPVRSVPAQQLTDLATSPFADTLYALAGSPSAMAVDRNTEDNTHEVLGRYTGHTRTGADTLSLSLVGLSGARGQPPGADYDTRVRQPEYVLAHEMGHRAYAYPTTLSAARPEQDSTYRASVQDPGADPDAYWVKNPNEHFAEAFANAVSFLRATAQKRPSLDMPATLRGAASDYEADVPGTALMVKRLLATPPYANHPLNTSAVVPAAQRDATTTPMQQILAQALLAAQKKRQGVK